MVIKEDKWIRRITIMKQLREFTSAPHMSGYEMGYIKEAFDSNWIAPLRRGWMLLKMKWHIILAAGRWR